MKKNLFYLVLVLAFAMCLNACYYDEVATFDGLPTNVSLKNDVQPIFDSNCNSSGCHDAGPNHAPSLTPENAYDALLPEYVNTIDPPKSRLYVSVTSGGMPLGGAPL